LVTLATRLHGGGGVKINDGIGFLIRLGVSAILGMMDLDVFAFFGDCTLVLVLEDDGGTVVGLPSFVVFVEVEFSWACTNIVLGPRMIMVGQYYLDMG